MAATSAAKEQATRAVVVGAGIVGACCAYALRRAGFDVLLIEKDEPGRAASYGNAGSIGLASTPPLGMPGMLKGVPRMLLDPRHALIIRWKHLPRVLPWFLKFAQTLKPERVEAISHARAALLAHAGEAYDDLLAEIGRPELIYGNGLIAAFETDETFAKARYGMELRRRTGIALREMNAAELKAIEPALSDKVRKGIFFPDVRTTTNPLRLTEAIVAAFRARGGELAKETVLAFEGGDAGIGAVVTDRGRHPCDLVVIAAGAWSRRLVRDLGDAIPLAAERGYHIMIGEPQVLPKTPIVSGDRNVSITPMEGDLRMSTMAEFAEIDAPPDHERALRIFEGAADLIRDLEVKVASRWVGSRPSTPDSLPVIGRSPRVPNVLYAFGHGHLGVTFGAITGRLIAQLARHDQPNIDISPYRPDRDYAGGHLMHRLTGKAS
ncbi:NAD(P)/FAD-dependent oxidoreductase [Chelatococcus sp. GCM10030263]|uniref:NAD(P)/FAD-dependent oxidoreductase n=1 Tax=Chelatococcus sp. GCM10030263 TaxID=3273387 RepID=UPI003616AF77